MSYPSLENYEETAHFVLRWTNSSPDPRDNLPRRSVVSATGTFLETARSKLVALLGRPPYVPSGQEKLEVAFHNLPYWGQAYPPSGPIRFNAHKWRQASGIRQPTATHELFHKFQYAFGLRTRWPIPTSSAEWYTEGTAALAELVVCDTVSRPQKWSKLFRRPNISLLRTDYTALPFWAFLQTTLIMPDFTPMRSLLEQFEITGDLLTSVDAVLQQATNLSPEDRCLDRVFLRFCLARLGRESLWPRAVLKPDGSVVAPDLAREPRFLGVGVVTETRRSYQAYSARYHEYSLPADGLPRMASITVSDMQGSIGIVAHDTHSTQSEIRITTTNGTAASIPVTCTPNERLIVIVSGLGSDSTCSFAVQLT